MSQFNKSNFSFLICATLLSGCAPVAAVTLSASAIDVATRDKNVGGSLSDADIRTKINMMWFENCPRMHRRISVSVKDGTAFLRGSLNDKNSKLKALSLTWKVEGVTQIIDHLKVTVVKNDQDNRVEKDIYEALKNDHSLNENRFNILVIDGNVYLLGYALTENEKERVMSIAHNLSNNQRLVDYIKVHG